MLQAAKYSNLKKGELDVWQALELIDELTECDTTFLEARDTDADLRLKEHSFQIAEACRLAYPQEDWLHLVGLIHDLGRLLRIKRYATLHPCQTRQEERVTEKVMPRLGV